MEENRLMQQGVDSRAMFATFMTKLPRLLILAAAGAVLGSGLHLLVTLMKVQERCYVSETEYYIKFDKGHDDAIHWYNDYTWNDVLTTDWIMGRAMELLGAGYERDQVKGMVRADILSDVRYLTITVRGQDAIQVEEIKNAFGTALEEFGGIEDAFASIEKIEDSEIVQEEIPYFTWRAAFLGAVVAAGAGVFVTALRVCMGSVFFTKRDITTRLGLPVCGVTFQGRCRGNSPMERRQAEMLEKNLKALAEDHPRILLMDAAGGRDADVFLREIRERGVMDCSCFQRYGQPGQELQDTAILVVVPFGRTYREKITDEIDYASQHGGRAAAAVLAQADRNWMRIYFAWS